MPRHRCSLGCGRFLSSDEGHKCCLPCLGIRHAEDMFGRSEGYSKGLSAGPAPADLLLFPQCLSCAAPGWFYWPASRWPSISFGAPPENQMLINSIRGWAIVHRGWRFGGAAPLGCCIGPAVSIGLEVCTPPSPEPLRLDDWFLDAGHGSWLHSFLPEGAWGSNKSWMATCTARSRSSPSSVLTTLNGGAARGYMDIPRWREQLRCTCAHKTPPLGGIVLVSRPKPESCRRLSLPKLTVLWVKPLLPCMPWLSCRSTKPRH